VKPGRVMFEIEGIAEDLARQAFALAAAKLPVKCRFVLSDRASDERKS
jgi:large subunit ribosomal protein L16